MPRCRPAYHPRTTIPASGDRPSMLMSRTARTTRDIRIGPATYNIKGGVGKTSTAVNLAYPSPRQRRPHAGVGPRPAGRCQLLLPGPAHVKGGSEALITGFGPDRAIRSTDYDNLDLNPGRLLLPQHGPRRSVGQEAHPPSSTCCIRRWPRATTSSPRLPAQHLPGHENVFRSAKRCACRSPDHPVAAHVSNSSTRSRGQPGPQKQTSWPSSRGRLPQDAHRELVERSPAERRECAGHPDPGHERHRFGWACTASRCRASP